MNMVVNIIYTEYWVFIAFFDKIINIVKNYNKIKAQCWIIRNSNLRYLTSANLCIFITRIIHEISSVRI